jgi:hypothetical protein
MLFPCLFRGCYSVTLYTLKYKKGKAIPVTGLVGQAVLREILKFIWGTYKVDIYTESNQPKTKIVP